MSDNVSGFQGNPSYLDFLAQISKQNLTTPNRYTVLLSVPSIGFTPEECMLCCNVVAPHPSFETFDWQNISPKIKFPFRLLFDPLRLTFYSFANGQPYKKFFGWQQMVYDKTTRMHDWNSYAKGNNVLVTQLDKQGNPIQNLAYYNCYPETISAKTLSYEQGSQAEKFEVTFNYEYMTLEFNN